MHSVAIEEVAWKWTKHAWKSGFLHGAERTLRQTADEDRILVKRTEQWVQVIQPRGGTVELDRLTVEHFLAVSEDWA